MTKAPTKAQSALKSPAKIEVKNVKSKPPDITLVHDKKSKVSNINFCLHGDEDGMSVLHKACGTTDDRFFSGLLEQLVRRDPDNFDFMLSVINGLEPRDQTEAMLAAQMASVHMATMTCARRLAHVESIPQQDSAERAFNKLARTFTTQMEALNRYRGKGQQKMTVEHVHVHDGGQAIVGNVEGGGVKK